MKALRTLAISMFLVAAGASPAFAQSAENPLEKVQPQQFWFQDNWFLNLTFIGTSVLLVLGFVLVYFLKVIRPKYRGRPAE
ncbi:MAG: hypothetical protein ACOYN3_09520 [Acidimicrobiia bacterium]